MDALLAKCIRRSDACLPRLSIFLSNLMSWSLSQSGGANHTYVQERDAIFQFAYDVLLKKLVVQRFAPARNGAFHSERLMVHVFVG